MQNIKDSHNTLTTWVFEANCYKNNLTKNTKKYKM